MIPDGVTIPVPQHVSQVRPEHLDPISLSLVVFGPGEGEAMVVVLPDGRVGVVDGCREPRSPDTGHGDPVREFLQLLEKQAQARGESLRLSFVCLTHAHDDHYSGLGRLLAAYRGRVDEVWSVVETGDRHASALRHYADATRAGRDPLPDDVKVRGLERVLSELTDAHRVHQSQLRHLGQGRRLLSTILGAHALCVEACGPADVDVKSAQFALVEAIEDLVMTGTHDVRFDPNAISGALILRWGQAGMLLGGDLLRAQGRYQGWDQLFKDISAPIQVIKIAHHASVEAHHEKLWTQLGAKLALVTPFNGAKVSMPPRPEQISRLAKDAVVAISAVPDWATTLGVPQAHYTKTFPSSSGSVAARNSALPLKAKSDARDIHNAIAVSLDPTGRVTRFVLAGKANVYEP